MDLLKLHLEACVPLVISGLSRTGGPTEWQQEQVIQEWVRVRNSSDDGMDGTESLYLSEKKGATALQTGRLVDALAIMAFVPGGVSFAGLHFEAVADQSHKD